MSLAQKYLFYLDGDPLFSAEDSDISSGTIGLFSTNRVSFDDVSIVENSSTNEPRLVIAKPEAYTLVTNDIINVSAVVRGLPAGAGVRFSLNQGQASFVDFSAPYTGQFSAVQAGNHEIEAVIVDGSSTPLANSTASDSNLQLGAQGYYLVAMGDSISRGQKDNLNSDDGLFRWKKH